MYKQWLTLVGDVLQHELEVRKREDPHTLTVVKDGLLFWPRSSHHLQKFCILIFANLHSFTKFANLFPMEICKHTVLDVCKLKYL